MRKVIDVSYIGNIDYGGMECEVSQIIYEGGDIYFDITPAYNEFDDIYFDRYV